MIGDVLMNIVVMVNLVGIIGIVCCLVQDGVLDEVVVCDVMVKVVVVKQLLLQWFVEYKLVLVGQLVVVNVLEFGMLLLDVLVFDSSQNVISFVSEELLCKYCVLLLFKCGGKLFVGISDLIYLLDEIKFYINLVVELILVDEEQIKCILEQWQFKYDILGLVFGGGDDDMGDLDVFSGDEEGGSLDVGVDVKGDDILVVKFVNKVLVDVICKGVLDIYFELYEDDYWVCFCIDGLFKNVVKVLVKFNQCIVVCLKVMLQLDIVEKCVLQDGCIKFNLFKIKQIDFCVSMLLMLFGEKIVLCILDGSVVKLGIDKFGYELNQQKLFLEVIYKFYGMVLVIGLIGLGKMVLLYMVLGIFNDEMCNIFIVEDLVEICLLGVNQVQQNNKCGMIFVVVLCLFLCQDLDIIMVGEICDLEMVEIVIKVVQIGYMVLFILYINDVLQIIVCLMNMGIVLFNIISLVILVIVQCLVWWLCGNCKWLIELFVYVLLVEGFIQEQIDVGIWLYELVGCEECIEGYKGCIGIYQVMLMSEEILVIVLVGGNVIQIVEVVQCVGVNDLCQLVLVKVVVGVISLVEINCVIKD